MKYSLEGRVRYSEVGVDGALTLPGILNYFQDSSTFQSEDLGQGVQAVHDRKRVWVMSFWQVVVKRYPMLGERIVTSTFPYDFKGFFGYRNFALYTDAGEPLVYANSIWTYLDVEKGVPARLTEEDIAGYESEPKLEMNYAPRKIRIPENRTECDPIPVQKHHLDTNHHVNNCQYITIAADLLPEGFVVQEMRAEYKKQVWPGEMLYPEIASEEDKIIVVLCSQEHVPCTIVEFLGHQQHSELEE